MTNTDKALNSLKNIAQALEEVKDLFPEIPKKISVDITKYKDPLRTLKKINGIIKNYSETNAELKLRNVLRLLGILPNKQEKAEKNTN